MASRGSASVLETIPLNHLPDTIPAPPLKKRKTWHSPGDGEDQAIRVRVCNIFCTDVHFNSPIVQFAFYFPHHN